jgi:CheY-like chemotaxis protein
MNKLVFIVEDNPVHQKMLQVHFDELGNYVVKTFANPEDMFAHLKEKPFAIVLDHFFGNHPKTGLQYLKELKKSNPAIPIIYYTTLTEARVRDEVMALGVEHFIAKDSASLVRLRTALDMVQEKSNKKGFLKKLFGR